jgi:hypothetical protein
MTEVIVVKELIDKDFRDKLMSYNDWLIENKIDKFYINEMDKERKRPMLQFGVDEDPLLNSNETFSSVLDKEQTESAIVVSNKAINAIKEKFSDDRDIYLTSFWFGKQYPGIGVGPHLDCEPGKNWHFEYSAILYLNTFENGELEFLDLNKTIKPDAGDLIIFKSKEGGMHKVAKLDNVRYTIPMWFTYDEKFALKS